VTRRVRLGINRPGTELLEDVLVTRHQDFIKGVGMRVTPRLLGQGLLASEGELWCRLARGFELKLLPTITLQPEDGVAVVIERR